MPTHLLQETIATFREVAIKKGVADPTVWRWYAHGLRGHKLECIKHQGRLVTSWEALERFQAKLNTVEPAPRSA